VFCNGGKAVNGKPICMWHIAATNLMPASIRAEIWSTLRAKRSNLAITGVTLARFAAAIAAEDCGLSLLLTFLVTRNEKPFFAA